MMKSIRLSVAIFSIVIASCSSSNKSAGTIPATIFDTTTLKQGTAFYQCPMHPEVFSSHPGDCTKCGMSLEKVIKH